jgi:TolA-binding protein
MQEKIQKVEAELSLRQDEGTSLESSEGRGSDHKIVEHVAREYETKEQVEQNIERVRQVQVHQKDALLTQAQTQISEMSASVIELQQRLQEANHRQLDLEAELKNRDIERQEAQKSSGRIEAARHDLAAAQRTALDLSKALDHKQVLDV